MYKELYHHGIKGQKWGVRRYKNEDGSYTEEGRTRYGLGERIKNKWNSLSPGKQKMIKYGAMIVGIGLANYGLRQMTKQSSNRVYDDYQEARNRYRNTANRGRRNVGNAYKEARDRYENIRDEYFRNQYENNTNRGRHVADDIFGKWGKTKAADAAKAPSVDEAKKALDEILKKAHDMEAHGGIDIDTKERLVNARNAYRAAKKAANGG